MALFYEKIDNRSLKECLKNSIRDVWTHSSTAIEGNTLTLDETRFILEEGLTIAGKTVREHNEIIGHSTAVDILYSAVSAELKFDTAKLFELHKAIMSDPVFDIYSPIGAWKVESNFTRVINTEDKVVIKEYPKPNRIPQLMAKWFELYKTIKNDTPVVQYCKLHILLSAIHPFYDGNGRMARLVANIPIIKNGFVPVTISKQSRLEYITLLQNTEFDEDLEITKGLDEFITFVEQEWKTSIELFEQAVNKDNEISN